MLGRFLPMAGLLLIVSSSACSPETMSIRSGPNGASDQTDDQNPGDRISVSVEQRLENFALRSAPVQAFSIEVTCDDREKITVTKDNFFLIGRPSNCKGRLTSFSAGDTRTDYTIERDFTTLETGEIAVFSGSNGGRAFATIGRQLPEKIEGPTRLTFTFVEIKPGGDLSIEVDEILNSVEGDAAPAYRFARAAIEGEWLKLTFTCDSNMSGRSFRRASCAGDRLSKVRITNEPLAANIDFNDLGVGFDALNIELLNQFSASSGIDLPRANSVYHAPSDKDLPRGGFTVFLPIEDTGTGLPFGLGRAYIIALQNSGSQSYLLSRLRVNVNTN